jgi:hypothetical protein
LWAPTFVCADWVTKPALPLKGFALTGWPGGNDFVHFPGIYLCKEVCDKDDDGNHIEWLTKQVAKQNKFLIF